jgi:hypothetical protein
MYKNILKFVEIKFKIDLKYSTHMCQNSHYQGYQREPRGNDGNIRQGLFIVLKKIKF